jgi:hypothetical protein
MEIPVLIEPIPGSGYRATGGSPFGFVVEGATPEAALDRLKDAITTKLRNGAIVVTIDVPVTPTHAKR